MRSNSRGGRSEIATRELKGRIIAMVAMQAKKRRIYFVRGFLAAIGCLLLLILRGSTVQSLSIGEQYGKLALLLIVVSIAPLSGYLVAFHCLKGEIENTTVEYPSDVTVNRKYGASYLFDWLFCTISLGVAGGAVDTSLVIAFGLGFLAFFGTGVTIRISPELGPYYRGKFFTPTMQVIVASALAFGFALLLVWLRTRGEMMRTVDSL